VTQWVICNRLSASETILFFPATSGNFPASMVPLTRTRQLPWASPEKVSMNFKWLGQVMLLTLLTGTYCLLSAHAGDGLGWKPVHSDECLFEVLMPGNPTASIEPHKSFLGTIQEHRYHVSLKNHLEFNVACSDLPSIALFLGGSKTILNRARKALVKNAKALETSVTIIDDADVVGREVTYEGNSPEGVALNGKARFFIFKKRLYIVDTMIPKTSNPKMTDRLFDSFKILPLSEN
jgi:hypothetical protein